MSSKRRPRKVTVENDKIALGDISSSEKRKLSVFERLGPGAPRKYDVTEKHSSVDAESSAGVCHKWQKYGTCQYGGKCRYQHGPRREHSPDEYHHHHGDKDSDSDSEVNGKSVSRDSKKDKIKSTVVVTKPNTLEESESDPAPDCTDEDLQRRLSQLKQELSRLDQEEKERERIERAGLAQISSDESEKDMPPIITPPTKHKKEKGAGEQTKKKKEKKKKKKKFQKLLPEGEEEKMEKKAHHSPLEKDMLKAKQKALEKPKPSEKPKAAEKKKAGPMIPRSVQQKVIKPRQSSSSASKSPSRSPSSVKRRKSSPKQAKREKGTATEKHADEGIKADITGHGEKGMRETQHHAYSPSYRSELKRDKAGEKAARSHRELSPKVEVKERSGERMPRSHRDVSPRVEPKDKAGGRSSRSRREQSPISVSRHREADREAVRGVGGRRRGRSTTPQSRHSQSDSHWSRKTASRRTSSSSSSTSSDSPSSSSPSPARSRRTLSPRRQYASPHRRSPSKRASARSQSLGRHGKGQPVYGKGSRKGKDAERSPSRRRDTMERVLRSRDRSVPVDVGKKRQAPEHELRKIEDLSRRHESSPRDGHWAEAPAEKLRRRRSPDDERKQAAGGAITVSDSRHDQVDVVDRSEQRKLEQAQSSRRRGSREVGDKRLHGSSSSTSKLPDEYAIDYDARTTHSVEASARTLSPTDRHRTDYVQYRDGYVSTTSERDRYAERDRYDVYAREAHDVYVRSDERSRDVERERDYVSSTVIDTRDRDRYDRESSYSHSHYASYVRDSDRLDVRRDYSAYYDDRGRLIEDTSRLRTEDLRGRDERSRDDYSRSYDRYRYLYEYEASMRSDVDRRRESSRDVSSDRGRSRDWQLERARWEHERLRDDPRLLDPEIARSVHDPRDLVDPRDLGRDHARDVRDVCIDSRSDLHADLRIKVHSDIRTDSRVDSRLDVRSDGRLDVRADSRLDVRGDGRVDLRADPRADIRDVHLTSRSRDRSTDTRESRGRTDRDRLADVEGKDLSHDHLSRRGQWEQTHRNWSTDKSKDRLATGSRKRNHGETEGGTKSPSAKYRREGSLDKEKRSVEHELHKVSSTRSKVSERVQDPRLDQKQSQERKSKDPEILYSSRMRGDKDYERDPERREKKYDKTQPKHGKESVEGEKGEHDSRSTSSRDADSKESRDSRSKEREAHTADLEQDRLYEHHSWTSKERDADLEHERQGRAKLRTAYEKERDKVDKDKLEESCATLSALSSHADYKRRRSHSVDSPRKPPHKKVREGEAVSDWLNPDRDLLDTDIAYKHKSGQVIDERFGHSPSHSSLGSKPGVPEEEHADRRDDRRDDHLLYGYDRDIRDLRARDDPLDKERSSRVDAKYLYMDLERDTSRTRSVDRGVAGHYSDRRAESEVRDDYRRDVDLVKCDIRPADSYTRDWTADERLDEIDRRSRDRDRDRDRALDHVDRERVADVAREHSTDRMDWIAAYRDHRTDSYVYPDPRLDSYARDADRLAPDHRDVADVDPHLDRRESPLERVDVHVDMKSVEHSYYDNQDTKRDRYSEIWPAPFPTTTASTPQSQTDPTLGTLPPVDNPAVQPAEEKGDGEMIEYDAISDDDLDDIIGQDQNSEGEEHKPQKTGIIDVLDIDWASLMKQNVPKLVTSGSALKRFTPASIFKKIGVSLQFAGEKLYTKIENICEKQPDENESSSAGEGDSKQMANDVKQEDPSQTVDKENGSITDTKAEDVKPNIKLEVMQPDGKPDVKSDQAKANEMGQGEAKPDVSDTSMAKPDESKQSDVPKQEELKPALVKSGAAKADATKFRLLHSIAQFHVSLVAKRRERDELLKDVGPYRRALCARRDLYMRKKLCKLDLDCDSLHLYPAQVVDQELYRQSVQIFRADRPQPLRAGLSTKPTTEQEIAA